MKRVGVRERERESEQERMANWFNRSLHTVVFNTWKYLIKTDLVYTI